MSKSLLFKFYLLFFCFIQLISCDNTSKKINASKFDFNAVDNFWNITDQLKKGSQPSAKQWKSLFANHSYKIIESANGLTSEVLKKRIQLCFDPNLKQKKDSLLNTLSIHEKAAYIHLIKADSLKLELKKFQNTLKKDTNYLEVLKKQTNHFLPKKYQNYNIPTIYVALFAENAHANSNGIVLDLLCSFYNDSYKKGALLAHELHHYVLDNTTALQQIKPAKRPNIDLLHKIFYHIQKEGIANLIDKKHLYLKNDFTSSVPEINEFIRSEFKKGELYTNKLSKKLLEIVSTPTKNYKWDDVQTSLPFYGHIVGYYMANAIYNDKDFSSKLALTVDDPISFFELYNQVISKKRSNYVVFDSKIMEYLTKNN